MGTPCDAPITLDAPPRDVPRHVASMPVMAGAMLEI